VQEFVELPDKYFRRLHMPYITLHTPDSTQAARYPLENAILIGRSPDCDIRIHDILASREHCALEPGENGWVIEDQKSRNGTTLNGQRVTRQALNHNDTLIVGRTRITFHDEILLEVSSPTREYSPSDRPANPFEALSGTVVDYSLNPKFQQPVDRPIIRPIPRPMPIANRSPLPESPAVNLPASLSEGESSPTWATKRTSSTPSARLMAAEEDIPAPLNIGPAPHVEIHQTNWKRRASAAVVEVIVASAITGAAVVGTVAALTR
jgi:pSer/pThr/pTyr-binding forkhead associated (FHA) protein